MKKELTLTSQNTQLVKKINTGLSITQKILPTAFNEVEWWNRLNDDWKKTFILNVHPYATEILLENSDESEIDKFIIDNKISLNINREEIKKILNLNKITIFSALVRIGDVANLAEAEISRLVNLEIILLCYNGVSYISDLPLNTKFLYLEFNGIKIIPPLKKLAILKGLNLGDNNISDISGLSLAVNLTSLTLSFNAISDISALSKLESLIDLSLDNNRISDITPLKNLTNLKRLWLHGNPITQENIEWLRKKLPNCNIYSDSDFDYEDDEEYEEYEENDEYKTDDDQLEYIPPLNSKERPSPDLEHIKQLIKELNQLHEDNPSLANQFKFLPDD